MTKELSKHKKCVVCGEDFILKSTSLKQVCCSMKCAYIYKRKKYKREFIKIDDVYSKMIIPSKKYGILEVFVDNDDINKIEHLTWVGRYDKNAKSIYITARENNKNISLHRFISKPQNNQEVDHINHNTLDNRKNNLRNCSRIENQNNKKFKKNISKRNKTGYVGVSYCERDRAYRAVITHKGKYYNLGYFKNLDEAINARKAKEQELQAIKNTEWEY